MDVFYVVTIFVVRVGNITWFLNVIFLNELLVLCNINAAKYRQKILQPFFEELHADELQERYFQQDGKFRRKLEEINIVLNMLEILLNALKMRTLKCSEEKGRHFQHLN
jgi:hypothetical protein